MLGFRARDAVASGDEMLVGAEGGLRGRGRSPVLPHPHGGPAVAVGVALLGLVYSNAPVSSTSATFAQRAQRGVSTMLPVLIDPLSWRVSGWLLGDPR